MAFKIRAMPPTDIEMVSHRSLERTGIQKDSPLSSIGQLDEKTTEVLDDIEWFSATHILRCIFHLKLEKIDVDFFDFHLVISTLLCIFVGMLLFLSERFRVDDVPESLRFQTSGVSFIDTFFLATAAFCGGGFTTVNLGLWSNPSFVILMFQMVFGCPVVTAVVFISLRVGYLNAAIRSIEVKHRKGAEWEKLIFHRECFLVALRMMVIQWIVCVLLGLIFISATVQVNYDDGKAIGFYIYDGTSCSTFRYKDYTNVNVSFLGGAELACYQQDPSQIKYYNPWWFGTFYSVSAITNTAFMWDPNALAPFKNDAMILIIIGMLVSVGMSYSPVILRWNLQLMERLSNNPNMYTAILNDFHVYIPNILNGYLTQLSVLYSLTFSSVAFVVIGANEWDNDILTDLAGPFQKLLVVWITVVSTRFAGFNCFNLSELHLSSILIIMALMFAPGTPVVDSTLPSSKLGGNLITIFQSHGRSFISRWTTRLLIAGFLITIIEEHRGTVPFDLLFASFELCSAFGTIGWSLGAPPGATTVLPGVSYSGYLIWPSKLIVIVILLLGRARDLNAFTNQLRQVELRGTDWPAIISSISKAPDRMRHSESVRMTLYGRRVAHSDADDCLSRCDSFEEAYLPSRNSLRSSTSSRRRPGSLHRDFVEAGVFSGSPEGSVRSGRNYSLEIPSPENIKKFKLRKYAINGDSGLSQRVTIAQLKALPPVRPDLSNFPGVVDRNSLSLDKKSTSLDRDSQSMNKNSPIMSKNSPIVDRISMSVEKHFPAVDRNSTSTTSSL